MMIWHGIVKMTQLTRFCYSKCPQKGLHVIHFQHPCRKRDCSGTMDVTAVLMMPARVPNQNSQCIHQAHPSLSRQELLSGCITAFVSIHENGLLHEASFQRTRTVVVRERSKISFQYGSYPQYSTHFSD